MKRQILCGLVVALSLAGKTYTMEKIRSCAPACVDRFFALKDDSLKFRYVGVRLVALACSYTAIGCSTHVILQSDLSNDPLAVPKVLGITCAYCASGIYTWLLGRMVILRHRGLKAAAAEKRARRQSTVEEDVL